MKSNLNAVDRVLRFALAFWWLGPFAPVYSATWVNWVIFIVGWIALLESFLGYCGLQHALGLDRK